MTSPPQTQPSRGEPDPVLELASVSKSFGGVRVLAEVSFDLLPGEIHALAGENGAGKSTFVKLIAGVYTPDSGTITVGGRTYDELDPRRARESGIAVVHQEFNLLPDLSVGENIFLGGLVPGRMGTVSPARWTAKAREILQRLGSGLDPRRMVAELTVAEQQLVEIAKALAVDARIILLDEPSTVLSGDELTTLHAVVRRLRSEGRSIIYISHRLTELLDLADRITVFKDGRHVTTRPAADLDSDELIRLMVGRPMMELFPERKPSIGRTVLEVEGLSVEGKITDISFALKEGEIVGVAGLGGSGRTTLTRALIGLEQRSAGQVRLSGETAPRSPRACARVGMVMVPEDRKAHGILAGQTVAFNLSLPSLGQLGRFNLLSPSAERSLADRLIKRFGVKTSSQTKDIEQLSGGNQQKVVLARWLAHTPAIVLLDEPTRGVDVGAKAEIYALIEELSRAGASVLLASSELPELLGTCDRVLVLREGRLVADIPRDRATEESIVAAAVLEATA